MRCWLVPFFRHIVSNRPDCSLLFCFQSINLNGIYPRILSKVSTWSKTHGYCGIEFEERDKQIWSIIRSWDNNQLRRVCVSILDRFSSNVKEEVVVLGRIIDVLDPNDRVVSVHGGPHAIVEAYVNFLDSGYWSRNWLSFRCLTSAFSNAARIGLRQACLALWTPTLWRNSSWNGWRGQRFVIGWFFDQRWRKPT